MSLDTLDDTLTHELSDLLSAENQFARALMQVARAADSDQVRQMAEEHFAETQGQIDNLKQAFSLLGEKPEKMVCKGAQGIVEENNSTLKEEKPKGSIKDTVLIGGSLRIEHYEIAGYSSAIALAKALGKREVVRLLQMNLRQEQATARKLEQAATALLATATSPAAPAAATPTGNGAAKGGSRGGSKGGAKSGSKGGAKSGSKGGANAASKGGSKSGARAGAKKGGARR
jgi:ferritin-like metal-binding protein YciE